MIYFCLDGRLGVNKGSCPNLVKERVGDQVALLVPFSRFGLRFETIGENSALLVMPMAVKDSVAGETILTESQGHSGSVVKLDESELRGQGAG